MRFSANTGIHHTCDPILNYMHALAAGDTYMVVAL